MTIIYVVFAVLQIILFFKVWGMTNNVKKMKDIVSKHAERSYYDVLLLKLKGCDAEADELYVDMFYRECIDVYMDIISLYIGSRRIQEWHNRYGEIKARYEDKLKDGSVNFARLENLPDVERILLSKV